MSDASSVVTYTSVYTDSEPWRYYEEDSAKTRPPRIIVYGYDGLPIQPVASPSPYYVSGPEHPPSPDYVPGTEHPPSPVEIPYPLPVDALPITASPDYVANSDPEKDPEEDPEDDQADYPADGGDGDDEPSDDEDDDDTDDEVPEEEPFKEDDEEKEEHLAPADSSVVPIVDHTCLRRARKTVRPEPPMSASIEACIARHVALPSPPLLVPSLPLPLPSPLTTSLTDTGAPLGYKAARIRMGALLPSTSRRTDIPEADMPPRKRVCLTTLALGFERVIELDTTVRQRTDEFDIRFEEAQDDRALLRARVNTLFRDKPDHYRTAMLMDKEAMYAREAWAYSVDRSSAIASHVRTLKTWVTALIAQTSSLQTQLTTALGRIEILKARDLEPQEEPTEAGKDSAKTRPPRIIVYGYDGLPIQPVAPPSPYYVSGLEHPPSPDYVPGPEHPPSPVEIPYVPEPEYPEYLAPSNDEAPLEDQPLPVDALPITASPDYVANSDPEKDPEEDPEDDQADYPADGGDGDDEPSDDDDDDDTDDEVPEEEPFKEDDEENEEHLAPADSSVVPIVDHTCLRRARKTVRPEPPMSASIEACIVRHAALPSPPLLVPSSPLPLPSPLTTSLTDTGAPLGYKAARIRMEALLPSTSRRTDILEADMPPRKRVCLTTLALGFEAGYGITDTWDEIVDTLMELAPTTLEEVNERVIELDTTVRQRTDEFDIRFEEAQDDRALLRARVNTLFRDRPDHYRIAMLMDREAMYAREAWAYSVDRSSAIAAHVRTLKTWVTALIAQTSSLQTQLTTALGRIEILKARDLEPQEEPTDAGSSCVATALAERDADRSRNCDNSNDLGTGGRRQMTTPRECTYTDFLKC
nr:hypothetical protein [Tanacetum cinerariifolium]